MYGSYLSLYERAEIGAYPQVYYVGQNCRHKKAASMDASHSNFGKIFDRRPAMCEEDNRKRGDGLTPMLFF
jgi:hypothetical protein